MLLCLFLFHVAVVQSVSIENEKVIWNFIVLQSISIFVVGIKRKILRSKEYHSATLDGRMHKGEKKAYHAAVIYNYYHHRNN